MPSKPRIEFLPTLSLLFGASLWGVIWYPLRLLEGGGLQGTWLTLILYSTALLCSLPFTWRAFASAQRHPLVFGMILLASGWTNVAFVEAVLQGNILRVLLLFYLSPLWAVMLERWLLHERMNPRAFISLGLAMLGALFMLWNPNLGFPWPRDPADWLALSAGFAFALSNVMVRKAVDLSIAAKALAAWLGVVLVALILVLLLGFPRPEVGPALWLAAMALGLFGIVVMTVSVQYGVTHMPVHRSAVIVMFELVAGAISQQVLTDEVVTAFEWFGGALIVIGAYNAMRASTSAT